MESKKEYKNLDELLQILLKMKQEGQGSMSVPKALFLLVEEIQKIKEHVGLE